MPSVVFNAKATLGESPRWDGTSGSIWWVDVPQGLLHHTSVSTGLDQTWQLPAPLSAVIATRDGRLLVALSDGAYDFEPETSVLEMIVPLEPEDRSRTTNDIASDATGRLWISTLDVRFAAQAGVLYRVDGRAATRVADGLTIPNGIGFSPDGGTLYLADSYQAAVYAFDLDIATGRLGERRILASVPRVDGLPDGLAVDAAGTVWVALFGGGAIRGFSSRGEVVGEIRLPVSQVTSCTFGGDHLKDLFVTTSRFGDLRPLTMSELGSQPHAGALFCIRMTTPGLVAPSFGGAPTIPATVDRS